MASKKNKKNDKQRRPRRQLTDEFRTDVVRLCQSEGESIFEVSKRLDLTESAVRGWVHKDTKRIADNLLQRDFTAAAPNRLWVTDVTALWTQAGWTYLAAIIDLFSRRIVGWAMSDSNDTALALAALDRALLLRKPCPGLVHHSDRGSPYGSDDYIARLDAVGIICSMSRKGDC